MSGVLTINKKTELELKMVHVENEDGQTNIQNNINELENLNKPSMNIKDKNGLCYFKTLN